MTTHENAVHDSLESLRGQWIEAVEVDAERTRTVTSRGSVLLGQTSAPNGGPMPHDGRLLGAVIAASTLAPDGVLTLALTHPDGGDPVLVATRAPWTLALPLGAGVAADADGRIGHRAATGPRVATPDAMATWASSSPDEIETVLLAAAADDWLSPGDVVSALVRSGVTEDGEIEERGIHALARLLARRDLVAGSIDETGFHRAPEPVEEVIEHVATVWRALGGRRPGPGQIAWFDLPPEAGP